MGTEDLKNNLNSYIDMYEEKHNEEDLIYFVNLYALILSKYREYFPELTMKLFTRLKSNMSYIKNIQKEFNSFFRIKILK